MKVFYHNDLDGICSGAIVRYKHKLTIPDDFFEINYGMPFPWHAINPGEKVFMVDFCLQPFRDMVKLHNILGPDLRWIDHHKTALKEYEDTVMPQIPGLRRDGTAACILTWEYCFNTKPPKVVELLGRYDIWDLDEEVIEFQMGMRLENFDLFNIFWDMMFSDAVYDKEPWINDIKEKGRIVQKWEDVRAKEYCKSYGIETFFLGHRVIAINSGYCGSRFFDAYYNSDNYDMYISYVRLPSNKWTVSLYSTKVDVSEIARVFGGGGHAGASGFQCDELPFSV